MNSMGGKGSGRYPKLSVEEHILRGTYRRDKHGPVPSPAGQLADSDGTIPEHLGDLEAGIWAELAPLLLRSPQERPAFEVLVCLMAELRRGQMQAGRLNVLIHLIKDFGATPAAAERLGIKRQDPHNPFAVYGREPMESILRGD